MDVVTKARWLRRTIVESWRGVSGEGLGMVKEASTWSDVTAVSLVRGNVTIR